MGEWEELKVGLVEKCFGSGRGACETGFIVFLSIFFFKKKKIQEVERE